MTLRTPSKRLSEIERADARAVPAPPSQTRATRATRQAAKPRQPEFDDEDDDDSSAPSAVAPAAAAVAHTPRRQRSSDDAAVATPAASPSRSPVASAAESAEVEDDTEALHASSRFQILRSVLLLLIFLLLYTLTQRYILEPTFQPHRSEGYKRAQEARMRAQIAANVCPPGQECEYDLNSDFKLAPRRDP